MKSLFLGVFPGFLLEISLEMLIKRIPINIVLLCLEDVIGFLFIEFQEDTIFCFLFHEHCIDGRRSRPLTPPSERCPTQK